VYIREHLGTKCLFKIVRGGGGWISGVDIRCLGLILIARELVYIKLLVI
jgi:hypothetical protein